MRRRTSRSLATSGRRLRDAVTTLHRSVTEQGGLSGLRARRPLSTLRCCRGYRVLAGSAARPVRLSITPMVETSVWARVPGLDDVFDLDPSPVDSEEG